MDKKIDILISTNTRFLEGMILCVLSILKYYDGCINLHIMTMDENKKGGLVRKSDVIKLEEVMRGKCSDSSIEILDLTDEYEKTYASSPNYRPKYTPYSLLRLFSERYISADRILYLDADTMLCDSVERFLEIDISDYEIAVSPDYMGRFWIKKDYFNSGVMYINMKKIRETHMFEKCIELIRRRYMYLTDQTAMYRLSTKRLYLPMRFNEQRDIKADTVVKHFNKGIKWLPFFHIYNVKQWEREKVRKKLKIRNFDDIYDSFDRLFASEEAANNFKQQKGNKL